MLNSKCWTVTGQTFSGELAARFDGQIVGHHDQQVNVGLPETRAHSTLWAEPSLSPPMLISKPT